MLGLTSIGSSKLRVAGTILFLSAKTEKTASTPPAAPSKCPVDDFVEERQSS